MRNITFLGLIFLMAFTSCRTVKNVTETDAVIKKMSARKIVKKHLENTLDVKTLDSKIKVRYTKYDKKGRERVEFTVRLRMRKDSVIWVKANKVITVFKAKITPTTFSFYSPVEKTYFEGDYIMLKQMLGVDINFSQLQNMLTGQSIFEMKGKKYDATIEGKSYKLVPKIQEELFDVFFKINPKHFKLDQLYLTNEKKNQSLRVNYKGYKLLSTTKVPTGIEINATEGINYTYMDLKYKSIQFNKPITIPFRIPKNYKRIVVR